LKAAPRASLGEGMNAIESVNEDLQRSSVVRIGSSQKCASTAARETTQVTGSRASVPRAGNLLPAL
jgi:hypothetical protein